MKQQKLKDYIQNNCLTGWELEWTDLSLQQLENMKDVIDEILQADKEENAVWDKFIKEHQFLLDR